jgi:branched-chain amino acid transport system permease protein
MFRRLLSNDLAHGRVVAAMLVLSLVVLAFGPFILPGAKALNIAAKILIFVVLVASFDLLLGYTGIVSFAHTMFFGIGAYGVAVSMTRLGNGWLSLLAGVLGALTVSGLLALAVGGFSLRVRAMFYSMITLAMAVAFQTLASQLSGITGGEDGITFRLPTWLMPSYRVLEEPVLRRIIDGRTLSYYLLFIMSVLLVLVILRIVNSPFGRVLQAVRENEFRAEAIGYRVVLYRTLSSVLSALFATLAGVMLAIWLRYAGPDAALSFEIMLDILLIITIGGTGTIYGAVIGTVLFLVAQGYLQDALALVGHRFQDLPLLAELFSPDRWLLWLGLLFVFAVYYVPDGVIGLLRPRRPSLRSGRSSVGSSAVDDSKS